MADTELIPLLGDVHLVNVRVQGAMRSYAFGFYGKGRAALLKNENGYHVLDVFDFDWEMDKQYCIEMQVEGNVICAGIDGRWLVKYTDEENPYLEGCIGLKTLEKSHLACSRISFVQENEKRMV